MRDYYIGIDLGTTNSAIAWGHIDSNQIKTEIIQIDRQIDEIGRTREDVLLPSCIYFQGPDNSIVGDYAKTMVQEQPECVAKSMKCYMGDGYEVFSGANGVHWTPVKIAAEILKYLKCRAEEFFQFAEGGCPKEDKLVITVPASFNSTMRQATLDAAKLAGFEKITDANLLSEPRAALHHFCNKDLPDRIDFSKPKKILVFDLGGGTLDVSLHCVHREAELIIDDIAVSDYTPFGGDNFDELVAKTLLGKYIKAFKPFPALSPVELELLEFQFQEYAEEAKKKLANQIQNARLAEYDDTNPCHPIKKTPTLPASARKLQPFEYELYWDEYKSITESFLAPSLTLESPCSSVGPNIITPILKVLDKGKKELDSPKRPKVDIVLLNGGMTKLSLIEERLEELFEDGIVRPEADADEAVALGAVVCQAK